MNHYVYRITNTRENRHYYGVRSCEISPKNDLGLIYFSSSTDKAFLNEQRLNKSIFKYKIVREFDNRFDAERFEVFLHKKFNVACSDSFYNKCNSTNMGFSVLGRKQTKSHIDKRFKNITGISWDDKYGLEVSKIKKERLKYERSEETKKKISKARTGYKASESTKQSISNGLFKRYKNKDFLDKFTKTMNEVNKNQEKRQKAGEKIKKLWQTPEYVDKMMKRKAPHVKTIKVTNNDGSTFTHEGLNSLCREYNLNITLVRKFLNCGIVVVDREIINDKTKNTLGKRFETL